jgi:predicted nucleic acid-binding protein
VVLVALLDANVLWSAAVRDTLLLAAEEHLFRPVWSRQILAEMARSLKAKRPDLDPTRIDRTVSQILTHFPESLIEDYESLIPLMKNHEGDRHVLAAAVKGNAEVVVTWNKADFPASACSPHDIEVQDPDEFLRSLWLQDRDALLSILLLQAHHLLNPPQSVAQVLSTLERSVPGFVGIVRVSGAL